MNKFFQIAIAAYLIYTISGCGNSVTSPIAGNVTFSINQQAGQNGGIEFLAKPSLDVKITKVISKEGTFADTIAPPPTYVFSKDSFYVINEYNGVATGQQWTFNFTGTVNSDNSSYNVTSNYSVP